MKVWSVVQIFLIIILLFFAVNMITQKMMPNITTDLNKTEKFENELNTLDEIVQRLENVAEKFEEKIQNKDRINNDSVNDNEDNENEDYENEEENSDNESDDDTSDVNRKEKYTRPKREKFTSYSGMPSKFGGDYLLLND